MKKSILLALAVALGTTGASAQMQGRPTPNSPPEQQGSGVRQGNMGQGNMGQGGMSRGLPDQNVHGNNGGSPMGSTTGGPNGTMSAPMHHDMMPPRHWTKDKAAWSGHAKRCSARYRSYNPRTDTYVVRRGVTRRCML